MKAVIREQDRQKLRQITAKVAQDNARRERLIDAICREADAGYITRRECLAIIRPTANTIERKAFQDALSRLIRTGKVREVPLLEPAGRAVRVDPVMVLQLVKQGVAA